MGAQRVHDPDQLSTPHQRWVLEEVLDHKRGGFFVEAGAADGYGYMSNSYFLESSYGWTGICCEPDPALYEKLKARRSCVCLNNALSEVDGEIQITINPDIPGTSGLPGAMPADIRARFFDPNKEYPQVKVRARPLADILRENDAPKHIDYFSLDIEGMEWPALKSFPFDEYTFGCLNIERGSKDYLRLRRHILRQGYELVDIGPMDDFFVHESLGFRRSLRKRIRNRIKGLGQEAKQLVRPWLTPAAG